MPRKTKLMKLIEQTPKSVLDRLEPSTSDLAGRVLERGPVIAACGKILDSELRPIHYQELTFLAYVYEFGVDPRSVRWQKGTIEDVREPIADPEKCGWKYYDSFRYASAPFASIHRPSWFREDDEIGTTPHRSKRLPIGIDDWETAYEAVMKRSTTMKRHGRTLAEVRRHGMEGELLQAVVTGWFAFNLGSRLLPASNHRVWDQWAWDDFRLMNSAGDELIVDVLKVGSWKDAKRAHLHIFAQFDDADRPKFVDVCEVQTGALWHPNGYPFEGSLSPIRLMVWQNMLAEGIDVDEYRAAIKTWESERKGHVDSGRRRPYVDPNQPTLFERTLVR